MKIDKAVVRATSAAVLITVMCARLVTYAINSLFEIDRPGVYGCAGACGLAGVFFGISGANDSWTRAVVAFVARHISPRVGVDALQGHRGLVTTLAVGIISVISIL